MFVPGRKAAGGGHTINRDRSAWKPDDTKRPRSRKRRRNAPILLIFPFVSRGRQLAVGDSAGTPVTIRGMTPSGLSLDSGTASRSVGTHAVIVFLKLSSELTNSAADPE